jgi:hypothetical protein
LPNLCSRPSLLRCYWLRNVHAGSSAWNAFSEQVRLVRRLQFISIVSQHLSKFFAQVFRTASFLIGTRSVEPRIPFSVEDNVQVCLDTDTTVGILRDARGGLPATKAVPFLVSCSSYERCWSGHRERPPDAQDIGHADEAVLNHVCPAVCHSQHHL